jgi:surface carbohydrate biosynthesis protein
MLLNPGQIRSGMVAALIIPVENQVRELDARLLLACIAARREIPSIIGPKREVESRIASFPRSIFLSKSLRIGRRRFFPISRKLGHKIVAWDEEALVHLPPDIYFSRRLSAAGMHYVSHLFAWGKDNAELWRQYPHLPPGMPIHVTGNPRGDLLRPEIRVFYQKDAEKILNTYGDFILINTNFNHVNAFHPAQNLFQPVKKPGERARFGQAAKGMTRQYAEGLRDHKEAVFKDFQQLIPTLEKAFSEHTIVVRPHPTENQEIYRQIAAQCQRVLVTNEGNVVPWLMATKAVIHNGCTTGVEAYFMGLPAISYRATVNNYYDYGFYQLPNRLSYQCFNFDELRETLAKILTGEIGVAGGEERETLANSHLAAKDGPLACERIVDVLQTMVDSPSQMDKPPYRDWLEGHLEAAIRRMGRSFAPYLPGSHKSPKFERHRYPEISVEEVRSRIATFQRVLSDNGEIHVNQIGKRLFRISD